VGKFIFVLGGAKSGKSAYTISYAKKNSAKVVYIATAKAGDLEMRERIKKHKLSRPKSWKTVEESFELLSALKKCASKYEIIIIDCLTLYLSNLMLKGLKSQEINKRVKNLTNYISKSNQTVLLISNEVGLGIVPQNKMAREFRDISGLANQIAAKKADEVIFMQAGIPTSIKNSKEI